MECRCTQADVLHASEAEEYAAEHLRSDGQTLVCPDTGARWQLEQHGEQQVLRQVDPEKHLSQRLG
jgi:hypothetical protein